MFDRLTHTTVGRIRSITIQIAARLRRFDGVIEQCIDAYRRATPHVAWRPHVFEAADETRTGGLVVYCDERHCEQSVRIERITGKDGEPHAFNSPVSEHTTTSVGSFYAAYFPTLSPGRYAVCEPGSYRQIRTFATVTAGACAEVRFF